MKFLHDIMVPLKVDITKFPNLKFKGIKTDSNKVTKGDIFVAIKGNKHDGNNYISQAVKSGGRGHHARRTGQRRFRPSRQSP